MDPAGDGWLGTYIRHLDQNLRNQILSRIGSGLYRRLYASELDDLPGTIRKEMTKGCDVYSMEFAYGECYIVDPCKEIGAIKMRMDICGYICALRQKKGITQDRLCELSGIPKKSISQIERGLWSPTVDILIKIGNALGAELRFVDKS